MTTKHPNILWFISDDTGFDMLGHTGGPPLTPHLDRLARDGITCAQFHTASPICTPSRYSYLTGVYPGHCSAPRFQQLHPRDRMYVLSFDTDLVPPQANIGSLFHAAGYRTGFVGKYHAGTLRDSQCPPNADPADPAVACQLRTEYAAMQAELRSNGFDYVEGLAWNNTDARRVKALQYHNLEWHVDAALQFLDAAEAGTQPFLLCCGFTTQHGPHHIRSLERPGRECEYGYLDELPAVQPIRVSVLERVRNTPGVELNHLTAGAAWMDDSVGAVLRRLDECGLAENTIVIYSTDHGPGTRSGKFTCYQGGTHIPFWLRWPGRIAPGATCGALLQNVDFVPTLLDMAGVSNGQATFDGRSRWAQLQGAPDDREDLYFELGRGRAVRTRRWKYIACRYTTREIAAMQTGQVDSAYAWVRGTGGEYAMHLYPHYFDPDQLYDLDHDPREQHNLAADPACRSVLAEMRGRLARYLERFAHPFPLDADPFQHSAAFRRLIEKNLADRSIFEVDWYRENAW